MIAIAIIGLIWLGWFMVDLGYYDPWYHDSLTTHKAIGMMVLVLAIIKILWILISKPPDFVPTIKPWEKFAARLAHGLLYVAMLAIPATGYVISTSAGDPIDMFGWFELPALLVADENSRDIAIVLHFYLAYGIAALVCIHAAAALKHHFISRDDTLKKML